MGNEIVSFITAILSMIPTEVLLVIAVFIGLLIVGYDNKKKAEREAEASKRRTPRKPSDKDDSNGQPR